MKRNLVLLAAVVVLGVLAAGLWAMRPDGADETSLPGEEAVVQAMPGRTLGAGDQRAVGAQPASPSLEAAPSLPEARVADEGAVGGGPDPLAGASIDRKIIQTASLTLQVEAVGEAFQEVGRIASAAGGFVASSTFSSASGGDNEEQQIASVTIRVPAVRFQEVLASLRGLAVKVEKEQSEASDVTEEFSDLSARLRNLEATEAQYLQFLKQAKDIGEVLQVQDRLNSVRAEIEHVRGRINLLNNLSDLATVTVHLRPQAAPAPTPDTGGPDPVRAAQDAWDASLDALRSVASGIITVAVFSWWLVPPLGLLALVLWQTLVRSRRQVEAR